MSNGVIKNKNKFKQSILFESLRLDPKDKRTGTDIDFEYEDGKTWIRCEVKEYGKNLTIGQRILLERFYHNLKNYNVHVFLLWHNEKVTNDIYIKDTLTAFYYTGKEWVNVIDLKGKLTFKHVFNKLV